MSSSSSPERPDLKFLIAFPTPDPSSGRRRAPNSTSTIARMINSSLAPIPNKLFSSPGPADRLATGCPPIRAGSSARSGALRASARRLRLTELLAHHLIERVGRLEPEHHDAVH